MCTCDLKDKSCKRNIVVTRQGNVYVENFFDCPNIIKYIEKYKDYKF